MKHDLILSSVSESTPPARKKLTFLMCRCLSPTHTPIFSTTHCRSTSGPQDPFSWPQRLTLELVLTHKPIWKIYNCPQDPPLPVVPQLPTGTRALKHHRPYPALIQHTAPAVLRRVGSQASLADLFPLRCGAANQPCPGSLGAVHCVSKRCGDPKARPVLAKHWRHHQSANLLKRNNLQDKFVALTCWLQANANINFFSDPRAMTTVQLFQGTIWRMLTLDP